MRVTIKDGNYSIGFGYHTIKNWDQMRNSCTSNKNNWE